MTDETYNGWSNRETWAADLHLSNDQGLYEGAREAVKGLHYYEPTSEHSESLDCGICGVSVFDHGDRPDDAIKAYVEQLREWRDDGEGQSVEDLRMMFDEIGSLWRVNWRELAEAFQE